MPELNLSWLRPSILAGFTLALLNVSRAHVWAAADETKQYSFGVAGLVPDAIAITLWLVAAATVCLAYWSFWFRVIGISLTAGLHASVAISAMFEPLAPELTSTVGSYGTIAILTLLIARMTDNRTVLEGPPDGLE